ncbi:M14 family metallopeptidase [Mumia flava]|nr:M14 family metallopeptidase [Mumia flava]
MGGVLAATGPASAETPKNEPGPRGSGLEVYTATVDSEGLDALGEVGVDRDHATTDVTKDGEAEVEVVLTPEQAGELEGEGVDLDVKEVDGVAASTMMARQAAAGFSVYRSYSEAGGIKDDLVATARANPSLTKLVKIGTSGTGQPIYALKVTTGAKWLKDGRKPSVLYGATQHAREWITPQMVQRLMHYMIDGYGSDREITKLLRTTELWFLPVQNPDGYDFTFTEGNRLWRKTLRDNNGDGVITNGDGVDMNRNFPYKWGYDNEGSSPQPASETYRGPEPASESETRATIGLVDKVGFDFFINYHSAAELILYGVGWQVETPTPDDEIYEALAGTDENPAIPNYDPDLSAELYTTNGDTDGHTHEEQGTLAFTPEMSTCQTISNADPDDEWEAADCASGFNFPDDEELIQQEFENNIPFALAVARSASDPDDPKSSVGLKTPTFDVDDFPVSYGTSQEVAVVAKRAVKNLKMTYKVREASPSKGKGKGKGKTKTRTVKAKEWRGGEKYGGENDIYYAEYRAEVPRQRSGDEVTVSFSGKLKSKGGKGSWGKRARTVKSESFSYTVADDIGDDVLVLAAEDYTGVSPAQADGPNYVDTYVDAVESAGYSTDVYDVDAAGRLAPHPLGVLSHYDAVVWETGEDVIARNVGQVPGTAAKWSYDTELNVRDYVNEGGKLLVAGKYALFAQAADGSYYYDPYEEAGDVGCTTPGADPCLPMGNDFLQYWLGSYQYVSDGGTTDDGTFPLVGDEDTLFDGWSASLNETQDHTAAFVSTSSFLPPDEFPQFTSEAPVSWDRGFGDPYAPYTGDWFVSSQSADQAYKRLARTVDLTGASSGSLDFRISADTETNWDFVFVEVAPVGTDDWTTLPDANGHTTQATGDSCASGWVDELHPKLAHYQGEDCSPTGTTGEWNAFSGNSSGWQDWSMDLSAYAGQEVEVAIVYATDWATTNLGVWIDDASVTVDGATVAETSFETDLGGWEVPGAPEGSGGNANDWERAQASVDEGAVITTPDTAMYGFGLEGLAPDEASDLMSRTLDHLFAE